MFRILLIASFALNAAAFGHASGGGHQHSTSMGDSSGGSSNWGGNSAGPGMGQMPSGLVGGGMMQPPPPPPPPPPPLSAPKIVKGTGQGVQSRVKAVGSPTSRPSRQEDVAPPARNISNIYEGGETQSGEADVVRLRDRMPKLDFVDVQ